MGGALGEAVVASTTGPDDELTDPREVLVPGGRHRRQALVRMVVTTQHHLDAPVLELLPQRLHAWLVLLAARAEARVMDHGERAPRLGPGELRPKPGGLGRGRVAAADPVADRVQDDDPPRPEVVAMPAHRRFIRGRGEWRQPFG